MYSRQSPGRQHPGDHQNPSNERAREAPRGSAQGRGVTGSLIPDLGPLTPEVTSEADLWNENEAFSCSSF